MFLFPRRVFCSEENDCDGVGEQGNGDSEERIPRRATGDGDGAKATLRLLVELAKRASAEDVVPIVERRREKLDGRMKGDHGSCHGLAGGVEIEAAPEVAVLLEQVV